MRRSLESSKSAPKFSHSIPGAIHLKSKKNAVRVDSNKCPFARLFGEQVPVQTQSTPNRIVWEYHRSLRLLAQAAQDSPMADVARQQAALAVIMSVTVVEVFLNIWFRIRVEESGSARDRSSLMDDLSKRKSLDFKLKTWPRRYLSKPIDPQSESWAAFSKVKELRNKIVHFTSSHHSVDIGQLKIHGMVDTTAYDALQGAHAIEAVWAADDLISEIFRLAGCSDVEIRSLMHLWTGAIAT